MFTGGSPGADRVVVGSWNGADAVFCGKFLSLSPPLSPFLSFFLFFFLFCWNGMKLRGLTFELFCGAL